MGPDKTSWAEETIGWFADSRADKDGRNVVLNYEDYNNIMIKELQQFEKMDVPVNGCDA